MHWMRRSRAFVPREGTSPRETQRAHRTFFMCEQRTTRFRQEWRWVGYDGRQTGKTTVNHALNAADVNRAARTQPSLQTNIDVAPVGLTGD